MKLTTAQKEANKQARKEAREKVKELKRIEQEKNQKPVEKITISIEWKKSRTWGSNPHANATIIHKNGTRSDFFATCSGCGYDKESTVIADIFNNFLKYKLFKEYQNTPYGMTADGKYNYYSGGIGTSRYYRIAEAIGGKFNHVANGKTFDVFEYIDNI